MVCIVEVEVEVDLEDLVELAHHMHMKQITIA